MKQLVVTLALFANCAAWAQPRTVLAVLAHPDDEVWWGASAMMARYAKEGHKVYLATVTLGQIGVTSWANIPAGPELGAAREEELKCSAAALGIEPPIVLGFFDQGLTANVVMDGTAKILRKIINDIRPEVVITHGPEGVSGHIDHRVTSAVTTEVFQEQARLAHGPSKLYYIAYPTGRIPLAAGATDGRRVYRTVGEPFITTEVESSAGNGAMDAALECHKSQASAADVRTLKAPTCRASCSCASP
ncbi:MAG: PIG-L family deacetylase [Bryobacterales bacterium]|nr:PIG-L family deacetylase [Bryobacterales bacterium]